MLISISYGYEQRESKYFDSLEELNEFMNKFIDIYGSDWESISLTILRGKEEKRVRRIREGEKKC